MPDNNDLFEGVDENAALLKFLNRKVLEQAENGNLTSNVANAVALGRTLQAGANNYARMKAASDQIWSADDMRRLMRELADAQHEAVVQVLDQSGLDERQRTELRYAIVDATVSRFEARLTSEQQRVTEDRANGITAFDQRLLENQEQN